MNKKAIVNTVDGLVMDVLEVKTFTDPVDFQKLCEEAKKNRKEYYKKLIEKQNEKEKNICDSLLSYNRRIHNLELEIALLKGEITEEEYNERYYKEDDKQ